MKSNNPSKSKLTNNVPKIPASIIHIGKFLQLFMPPLATKYAIRLFATPIKYKTPEREKMMAKSAQKEMVLIPNLNKEVMVYSYGYSKRKVLLIHGWSGRGTQLYKIADKLLENGFMTISFDAPAHGKSTGKTTMMTEFIATALFLEEKYGPFEIAIGHSLGGMSTLNSVKQGLKINKAITIGAGDIITDILTNFVNKLEFKQTMILKMKRFFLKKFGEDIDNYSASIASKDVKIPVLVIHDTEDKEVSVRCGYNIRQNLEQGEILITNGLGHTRILKDNKVINRIIEFIKRDT
ncbi:pimeloyl-ACP methyl ester carboxylesterase [Lutibacter oceani]|uniref:Pimeloyl-ACP methyl ester carboxylesterase n=1 Tax=Lutibacter oceani TaxID=1853311 RepID=A0A3D9RXL2_9FLAO|nr:alpha/beta hydrolase [Lutibacter oceani]REE82334.1 pimeloyl-ACP methyl ester carboxylesterase [Lutibacter oceani]